MRKEDVKNEILSMHVEGQRERRKQRTKELLKLVCRISIWRDNKKTYLTMFYKGEGLLRTMINYVIDEMLTAAVCYTSSID